MIVTFVDHYTPMMQAAQTAADHSHRAVMTAALSATWLKIFIAGSARWIPVWA